MFVGIGSGLVGGGVQASIQSLLFGLGEPGVMFDPTDITTMYVDRAGTTPVTAAGQSVGLRLSKDQGLRLGPELVTNGDFASSSSWNPIGSNITITGGALVISGAANNSGYYQASTSYAGGAFEVVVVISSLAAGAVTATLGIPSPTGSNCFNMTAAGTYRFQQANFTADTNLRVYSVGASTTATIDSVSVKALAGNHEVAVSDAKRGVYGWMPKTGKRNLLTYTEQFDNAAWSKQNAGTGLAPVVTVNAATAPDGTTTADLVAFNRGAGNLVADRSVLVQAPSGITSNTYVGSIWLKAATSGDIGKQIGIRTVGGTNYGVVTLTADWERVTRVETGSGSNFELASRGTITVGNQVSVHVWGAQLEQGSTATACQRVNSQYDVTEAGVPTCYYVQADGVDDAYVTPTITPNTDKAQVFAGVRRLVDTAGVIIEHSANWDTNNGSFLFWGGTSGSGTGAGFSSASRGDAVATSGQFSAASNVALTPPVSAVVTALHDIAASLSTSRANGFSGTATTAKGAGNFLAYPAYIYGRGGTSLPFNGLDFGHAVRFGPNLDAATIARVEALIARNTPEVTL